MGKSSANKARLSAETKQNIYDAVKAGASQVTVADRFGVSQSTVNRIVHAKDDKVRIVVSDEEGELRYDSATDSYIGVAYLPDGSKAGERFTNSKHIHERDVIAKYRTWRKNRLDEHQFMSMVERRDPTVPAKRGEPVEADGQVEVHHVTAKVVEEAFDASVHVAMLRGENAKAVGWYRTAEAARAAVDSMNEALTMAGFEPMYSVCECECKG